MQAQLVVYNKKIFKDNGRQPAKKTWDEMMALTAGAEELRTSRRSPTARRLRGRTETIVGGLLSSMLGKEFRGGHRLRRAESSPIRASSARSPSWKDIGQYFAELHRRRLPVLAAALRGRPRGDVRGRFL